MTHLITLPVAVPTSSVNSNRSSVTYSRYRVTSADVDRKWTVRSCLSGLRVSLLCIVNIVVIVIVHWRRMLAVFTEP